MPNALFKEILKDHKEVRGILKKLEKTSTDDKKKREDLFAELVKELHPHHEAEEHSWFETLKKEEKAKDEALEAWEEHHVIELLYKEMEDLDKSDDRWTAKLSVLKELIEHHLEEEEDDLFEITEKVLDKDKIKELAEAFTKEKEKAKG